MSTELKTVGWVDPKSGRVWNKEFTKVMVPLVLRSEAEEEIARLRDALKDTLQALNWLSLGEWQNVNRRALQAAQQAESKARAALTSGEHQ